MTPDHSPPVRSFADIHDILTAEGAPFELAQIVVRGAPMTTFRHAPLTLKDTFVAGRAYGASVFLVLQDERVTFEAFSRATLALAAEWRSRGLAKGDRVAIVMRNLPEWPVAFFAASLCGAVAAPLNAWWTGEEILFALEDSGARFLVADGERMLRLKGRALPDGLERIYVARGEPYPNIALEAVIGSPKDWNRLPGGDYPAVSLDPEDPATLFYTSGTSGYPKGVIGTHRNNGLNIHILGWGQAAAALRAGAELRDLSKAGGQKAVLLSIPLFHTTGCQAAMIPALASGGKVVLARRFDASEALDLIRAEGVTTAGGVPTTTWQLLDRAQEDTSALSSLETLSFGGAAASEEMVNRILARTSARPATGWGMTETSATTTYVMGEDYVRRPNTCGRPSPISTLRVVDQEGRSLPTGETGELLAYGPNVASGYWNRPADTAATFDGGWVRTGDLAWLDEEGFCYIVDRTKDLIIRGGENIAPAEVENILFSYPGVADVAVVGRPDPVLGEVAEAFIVPAVGSIVAPDKLREHCRGRLAPYKIPAAFHLHAEPLPRNAVGKVLKTELRARLATMMRSAPG